MEIIVYTALILLLAHLALGVILWLRVRKLYSYPGMLGFPVISNLYYFYKSMLLCTVDMAHNYLNSIAENNKDIGLSFHWIFGYNVMAVITSPQLIKKLSIHPDLADKPYVMYGGLGCVFDGPFQRLRADDEWKLKRKEYKIRLKKSCVDNDYYKTFIECADKMVDMILDESPSDVDTCGLSISVAHDMSVRTLFGFETSLLYHPEVVRVLTIMNEVGSILATNAFSMNSLYFIIQNFFDKIIGKVAEVRKLLLEDTNNKLKTNMPHEEMPLSVCVASRLRKQNGSDELLMKELQELFITSGHTIATTLANTINFLAMLPDIQERAWQEQYQIFGNDSRDPTIEDLNQMQFLDRFIKESLRFLGPSFLSRRATADINVDGITIPRDTIIVFHLRYIKFDSKLWEKPNAFDPDRFLEENDLLKFSHLPFGIGVRNCPGMYYATTFMKIVLSKLLRRVKLRPAEKEICFEDIKYKCHLMAEMGNPPKIKAEKRL